MTVIQVAIEVDFTKTYTEQKNEFTRQYMRQYLTALMKEYPSVSQAAIAVHTDRKHLGSLIRYYLR
jgi:hypothetical protein